MREPLLHHSSRRFIMLLANNLPQSLLLGGPQGIGLLTTAKYLANSHLATILSPRDAKGNQDEYRGTITIDMIRGLYQQTRTRHTSKHVVVIDNADRMSRGGQSAFLKLLEEPGSSIHFILTSHDTQQLLPTIRSRVQHINLRPLSTLQSSEFLQTLEVNDPIKRTRLEFMASGLPAEMKRLVDNDAYFESRTSIMGDARDFLLSDTYQKLLIVHKYRTNRDNTLRLIDSAISILRHTIGSKPQPALIQQLNRLVLASEHIRVNYSVQLQLMQLVV